jgi:intraflagellar transport protein 20
MSMNGCFTMSLAQLCTADLVTSSLWLPFPPHPTPPHPFRTTEIQTFSDTVNTLVGILSRQADLIEREKLKAIGQRNLVEHEREIRKRRQQEVRSIVAEKKAELERLRVQYECLLRVELEQKELIDRLSNNEAV